MKKLPNLVDFSLHPEMKLVKEEARMNDLTALVQLSPGLAGIVDFRRFITPLKIQPLDIKFNRILKRGADIIISGIFILTVLSWLIPLLALLIRLDSKGPVFFLQRRNKRNGQLFTCIKFRSMKVNTNADILPAEKNDSRVTRLGKFLRNHYIDELPQLFNVFGGDMSLIGPRPHMVSDNLKYDLLIKSYDYRHKVKPGITGLAQVLGYVGSVDDLKMMEARVNLDMFYIRHWSSRLDLLILYRTVRKTLGV